MRPPEIDVPAGAARAAPARRRGRQQLDGARSARRRAEGGGGRRGARRSGGREGLPASSIAWTRRCRRARCSRRRSASSRATPRRCWRSRRARCAAWGGAKPPTLRCCSRCSSAGWRRRVRAERAGGCSAGWRCSPRPIRRAPPTRWGSGSARSTRRRGTARRRWRARGRAGSPRRWGSSRSSAVWPLSRPRRPPGSRGPAGWRWRGALPPSAGRAGARGRAGRGGARRPIPTIRRCCSPRFRARSSPAQWRRRARRSIARPSSRTIATGRRRWWASRRTSPSCTRATTRRRRGATAACSRRAPAIRSRWRRWSGSPRARATPRRR